MKYSLLLILAIFFHLSCEKEVIRTTSCLDNTESEYPVQLPEDEICIDDECLNYTNIWRGLFQEQNNLSDEFLEDHIRFHNVGINEWSKGKSFNICYEVNVAWATAIACDQFIIYINAEDKTYPAVPLPRGQNLNKEEIKLAIENRAFHSQLILLNNKEEIQYLNLGSALHDLIEFSGVNVMCFTRLRVNKETGNLTLEALASYNNEENSCIRGTLDLITGEKQVSDTNCYI